MALCNAKHVFTRDFARPMKTEGIQVVREVKRKGFADAILANMQRTG